MQVEYYPDFTEFRKKCREGNVVPVYRQLMADTLTPVSAFEKIAGGPYAFLFESASGPENIGRYCFLGSSPFATFRCVGNRVEVEERGAQARSLRGDPLDAFRSYLGRFKLAAVAGLPRFSCGAVGWMAYDVVRFIERLPDCPPDDRGLPDLFFMFFDEILIFDNLNKTIKVVCSQRTDSKRPRKAYHEAV